MRRSKKETVLPPVHPNLGIQAAYRRRLDALISEMTHSTTFWLMAAYRSNGPEMATDAMPADELQRSVRELSTRWQKRFGKLAEKLAKYFADSVQSRSDTRLRRILEEGGISVEFKMTRQMRDVLKATIHENVALIKSIPAHYMTQVEGVVMRSVSAGRDLASLSKDLQQSYGVTRRRAAFIARDQNNKSTANFNRVRQTELGVTEAEWRHSGGGKHPRPTHVKAGQNKARYSVADGWYDPAVKKYILPGELPNCRCVSRSVIPGFI